jgi:hypothetical protein
MVLEMTPSAVETNNAFFLMRGHCFRMTKSFGLTARCDGPVVWKGPWRDTKGRVWTVESCAEHRPDEVAKAPDVASSTNVTRGGNNG